jgi:hypothetical protein
MNCPLEEIIGQVGKSMIKRIWFQCQGLDK